MENFSFYNPEMADKITKEGSHWLTQIIADSFGVSLETVKYYNEHNDKDLGIYIVDNWQKKKKKEELKQLERNLKLKKIMKNVQ
jgi:hypothetical protein